jgi:DNA-binding transcriptional MerR regulator
MSRTWRIGEVAERTGLTRRTLRHYDELGLLVPSARSWGDYRLYDGADLLRLLQIQNLKALGLSLAEVAEALADPSLDAAATLRGHLDHLEEQIASEQRLATRLRTLAEASERSWEDVLDVIALTRRQAHRDPIVRLRAALDPGRRSTEELFSSLLSEAEPGVQEVLIWALAQRSEAAEAAAARMATAEVSSRVLLARLLGKAGDRRQAAPLIDLLSDPEPRVVRAAVAALAQLADPSAATALTALLGSGQVPDADLIDALTAIGAPALAPAIELLRAAPPPARAAAAELLGRLRGESSTELGARSSTLVAALGDPELEVRVAVLVALGELGEVGRAGVASMSSDAQLGGLARRLLEVHVT